MLESVKLAIVMAVALSFCSPCSSGAIEETIDYETTNSDRTYPNDWTHRPLGELFTSLSCVYCMSYACLLYTSPSPRDVEESRMPSSA